MSETPTYDRLRELADAGLRVAREERRAMDSATYRLVRGLSKAVTSGQRAGERAAHNVFDGFVRKHGYVTAPREVAMRANEMAKVASARARERAAKKLLA